MQAKQPSSPAPLSLDRLRNAFAQMLGRPAGAAADRTAAAAAPTAAIDPCEIGTTSVVEAALFVGRPDGQALSRQQLAAVLRDVPPHEIDEAVDALNQTYRSRHAPYEIVRSAAGYRMRLGAAWGRTRDRFYGRVAEAALSPMALEVLATVAYHQPIAMADIDRLRGARSGPTAAQLVRRGLIEADRSQAPPVYRTTPRFLKLFGLTDPSQLPRPAELDD